MRLPFLLVMVFLFVFINLSAQQISKSDYVEYAKAYKDIAIKEMKLYKVPASITLAQGMIESGCGKSKLALESNNHFGIKCKADWTGGKTYIDDDKPNECFRKYKTVEESYRDHSSFLSSKKRYEFLFALPITDYKGWAQGLKQAGYATNPEYANILIRLIENNQLFKYDDSTCNGLETEKSRKELHEVNGEENKKETKAISKSIKREDGGILFLKNYSMPDPSRFELAYTSESGRKVYWNQKVPFIFAQEGDSWYSIAREFGLFSFQVYRMNDLKKGDPITKGQILYLEHKKKKHPDKKYIVRKGDSLYSIAQEKCIKLRRLCKYNKLKQDNDIKAGQIIKLAK